MDQHNIRAIRVRSQRQAREILERLGADPRGIEIMQSKLCHYVLEVQNVSLKGALIIKQEMLSLGGEAALPKEAANLAIEKCNLLLSGTVKQLLALAAKLTRQPFGLKKVARELEESVRVLREERSGFWRCRDFQLPLGSKTYLMGILNITPDSFSDGGLFLDYQRAVDRARRMVAEGADIIDIGGESTRPGALPVSEEEELERVVPVVQRLAQELAVPISVDTTKYQVAKECLEAGASIINDISGLQRQPRLAELAAQYGAGLVLMHSKGTPETMQDNPEYDDVVSEVIAFLRGAVNQSMAWHVAPEQVVIDPGIGFGKTLGDNLELMQRLAELNVIGYPILLGTSRKSLIGKVLETSIDDRLEGTAATVTLGIQAGVDVVRVHDIVEMAKVVKMTDAIIRYTK